jgi:excisionase family DNA binding protein
MRGAMDNSVKTEKRYYTEKEFCERVGIGVRTARRLRQAGELTHGRTGRKVWYTENHVEAYFREHTVQAVRYSGLRSVA